MPKIHFQIKILKPPQEKKGKGKACAGAERALVRFEPKRL